MKRKYISVNYSKETQERLRLWAEKNGFDTSVDFKGNPLEEPFSYHSTVMSSKNSSKLMDGTYKIAPTEVEITGFSWYSPNVPVLEIKSPELSVMHSRYVEFGLIHQYNCFLPHISVAYDFRVRSAPIELPDFPIIYDELLVTNVID